MSMTVAMAVFLMSSLVMMTMIVIVSMSMIVIVTALMKNVHHDDVENQTEYGGNKHNWSINRVLDEDSVEGFDDEPHGKYQQKHNGNNGTNNLTSLPSIGVLFRSLLLR
jgi:hypothetical protein